MNEGLPLIGAIIAMLAACYWGGGIIYITRFYRKHNIAFQSSLYFLQFFISGNIKQFYTAFYSARAELGCSKVVTILLIVSHLASPIIFFMGPILTAEFY